MGLFIIERDNFGVGEEEHFEIRQLKAVLTDWQVSAALNPLQSEIDHVGLGSYSGLYVNRRT